MTRRVVLLIRNASANDFGGAETYQVSLASILIKQGYIPIVITRSGRLINYAHNHSVDTIRGWWWSKQNWSGRQATLFPAYIFWQVILSFWYISLILRTGASILHIQSKDDFIAATFAGRLCRRRVVWTDHMDLRYIFENIRRPLKNPVGKLVANAARFAHSIIIISDNEHRLIVGHVGDQSTLIDKISIIKNGVIDQHDHYPKRHATSTFTFCIASRLVVNKGVGEAIEAFSRISSPSMTLQLAIYGDGNDRKIFEISAQNDPRITFYGHTDNAIAMINDADVFLLPSYQEGFSIALLEATMLGKAIIASDVDSNGEIVINGSSGLLVPAHDVDALSAAMQQLVMNHDLTDLLGSNARKLYETQFNLESIVVKQIIPLYLNTV